MKKIIEKITNWELWPFYVIYTPLVFVWLYFFIKAKAFWYFSNVNPTLEFSGFEGETKREMFDQLPKNLYPTTIYITHTDSFENVLQQIAAANLQLPVAVKPDIGSQGLCFRKIDTIDELKTYHQVLKVNYLIQNFVNEPLELSIFYVRMPNSNNGKITGLIAKDYLHVMGNGQQNLLQLIKNHPKAKLRVQELTVKHSANFNEIIPNNTKYILSIAGNHNRGANFINLSHEIDEALTNTINKISLYTKYFYYGRFDLKTSSLQDLKQGKNIYILEFNGVGSEPNHIYDCNMPYFTALKTIAKHWQYMYQIGKINNQNGVPYKNLQQGIKQLQTAKAVYKKLEEFEKFC